MRPTTSWTGTRGGFNVGSARSMSAASAPQTPQASTAISTSPTPGAGVVRSTSWSVLGGRDLHGPVGRFYHADLDLSVIPATARSAASTAPAR